MNYEYVYNCVDKFKEQFINTEEERKNLINTFKEKKDFLILEFPNNMKISGMTLEKKDKDLIYKCIYINTNEPVGRRNFSFAHELYHVYFEKAKRGYSLSKDFNKDEIEKKAELFASNLLIPRIELLKYLKEFGCRDYKEISMEKIFSIQEKFNASFQAIVYSIESLNKDKRYSKYIKYVPKIPESYKMYYKTNWEKLESETLKYNHKNNLNSVEPEYILPDRFRILLIENYKAGRVGYDEAESVFSFFNEKFSV